MNIKELKESNRIVFEAIAGSRAYGTSNPDSDFDVRGLFICPKNERITLINIPQEISNDSQDIKYYELEKFLRLASECNPSIVELMYLPEDCIKIQTSLMDKLIENRNLFISKKAYHTFNGYAYSMLHKAKSQNRFVNNPKSEIQPVKEDFCFVIPVTDYSTSNNHPLFFEDGFCRNLYRYTSTETHNQLELTPYRPIPLKNINIDLSKFHCARLEQTQHTYRLYYYSNEARGVFRGNDMLVPESIPLDDEARRFCGFLIYNESLFDKELRDWKNYWEWRNNRSEARWKDQENGLFQYDRKNCSHCVRLILSGKNILTKGEPIVRFTGSDLQYLKDIREGKIPYETLMANIELLMKELEEVYNTSTLPWGSDIKKIDKLYRELIEGKKWWHFWK